MPELLRRLPSGARWARRTWREFRHSGHSAAVTALALSADGETLYTASKDATCRAWCLDTGSCFRVLEGHTKEVTCLALVGDAVVSGSADCSLRVFPTRDDDGGASWPLLGHTDVVRALLPLAAAPGTIVSASDDKTLRQWAVRSRAALRVFRGHLAPVSRLVELPGRGAVVSGGGDCQVRLWNVGSGACELSFSGHASIITAMAADDAGGALLTGSSKGRIIAWNLRSGNVQRSLLGHTGAVLSLVLALPLLCSGAADAAVVVWDLPSGAALARFARHSAPVTCLALRRGGAELVSGSADASVVVYDLASRSVTAEHVHVKAVTALAVAGPGPGVVYAASADGSVRPCSAARHALNGARGTWPNALGGLLKLLADSSVLVSYPLADVPTSYVTKTTVLLALADPLELLAWPFVAMKDHLKEYEQVHFFVSVALVGLLTALMLANRQWALFWKLEPEQLRAEGRAAWQTRGVATVSWHVAWALSTILFMPICDALLGAVYHHADSAAHAWLAAACLAGYVPLVMRLDTVQGDVCSIDGSSLLSARGDFLEHATERSHAYSLRSVRFQRLFFLLKTTYLLLSVMTDGLHGGYLAVAGAMLALSLLFEPYHDAAANRLQSGLLLAVVWVNAWPAHDALLLPVIALGAALHSPLAAALAWAQPWGGATSTATAAGESQAFYPVLSLARSRDAAAQQAGTRSLRGQSRSLANCVAMAEQGVCPALMAVLRRNMHLRPGDAPARELELRVEATKFAIATLGNVALVKGTEPLLAHQLADQGLIEVLLHLLSQPARPLAAPSPAHPQRGRPLRHTFSGRLFSFRSASDLNLPPAAAPPEKEKENTVVDVDVHCYAVNALMNVCHTDALRKRLVDAGICGTLLPLLDHAAGTASPQYERATQGDVHYSPSTVGIACRLFSTLGLTNQVDPLLKRAILASGVVPPLLALAGVAPGARQPLRDWSLRALRAVTNLHDHALDSAERAFLSLAMLELGLLTPILLHLGSPDANFARYAASGLFTLTEDEPCRRTLVGALRARHVDAMLAAAARDALTRKDVAGAIDNLLADDAFAKRFASRVRGHEALAERRGSGSGGGSGLAFALDRNAPVGVTELSPKPMRAPPDSVLAAVGGGGGGSPARARARLGAPSRLRRDVTEPAREAPGRCIVRAETSPAGLGGSPAGLGAGSPRPARRLSKRGGTGKRAADGEAQPPRMRKSLRRSSSSSLSSPSSSSLDAAAVATPRRRRSKRLQATPGDGDEDGGEGLRQRRRLRRG